MYRSSLPLPHPSLPPQPAASSSTLYPNPQPGHSYTAYYNSHYVQAYQQPPPPSGSAYLNNPSSQNPNAYYTMQGSSSGRVGNSNNPDPIWYQAGNNRCSHPGCMFTGSPKTVEIHMMDRHLIYPPGWEKRKKKPEWDADPSLKGKPIPIQGTNVILDTPEVLEAWIAERKMRFPTSARVDDKKRKLEEAVARGQLDFTEVGRPNKRRNITNYDSPSPGQGMQGKFMNNRAKQRSGVRNERRREQDSGWPRKPKGKEPPREIKEVDSPLLVESDSESPSGDDEGDEPEAVSSKVVPQEQLPSGGHQVTDMTVNQAAMPKIVARDGSVKNTRPQPRKPQKNPFASRPTLLRNLLLPEIRVTLSNLSQAIRFLVDNDFLRDVELKPGQAVESNKIQIVNFDGNTEGEGSADPFI